jgi:hypothetical protein
VILCIFTFNNTAPAALSMDNAILICSSWFLAESRHVIQYGGAHDWRKNSENILILEFRGYFLRVGRANRNKDSK